MFGALHRTEADDGLHKHHKKSGSREHSDDDIADKPHAFSQDGSRRGPPEWGCLTTNPVFYVADDHDTLVVEQEDRSDKPKLFCPPIIGEQRGYPTLVVDAYPEELIDKPKPCHKDGASETRTHGIPTIHTRAYLSPVPTIEAASSGRDRKQRVNTIEDRVGQLGYETDSSDEFIVVPSEESHNEDDDVVKDIHKNTKGTY